MEIVFEKVSNQIFHNLSLILSPGKIIGVTGTNKTEFLKTLNYLLPVEGNATCKEMAYTKDNQYEIRKNMSYVEQKFQGYSFLETVEEQILFLLRHNCLTIEEPRKKILAAFKMVGLKESDLEKKLIVLSNSEKKQLQLAIALLSNPRILLLDEPFLYLDAKTQKKLERLFIKLKERYHKTIVIASSNSNMLYQLTEEMYFLKNGTILKKGKTTTLYQNVNFLERYHYEVPPLAKFTSQSVKEKGAKLEYHKDIRDLIKDIYKHV